jgi:DNA-binding transcriptional LysR family regulator
VRSKALLRTEKGDRFLPAARGLSDAVAAAFKSIGASSDEAEYLDLRHFDRFVRLTRAGSVAKFAKISRRDPSPIFAELNSFEQEFLRTELFERPRRSLKLTIAGQRLLP